MVAPSGRYLRGMDREVIIATARNSNTAHAPPLPRARTRARALALNVFPSRPRVAPQLQEKMEQQRVAAAEKISKKERIEKKLLKEEAIAVCYICNGGEHFENRSDLQEIVFCERCCVAVHSSCYGFDAEEVRERGGGGTEKERS